MPYQIRIDRTLCSGYGECVGIAPEVFQLGDDNVSIVVDPEGADDEMILDAARACPVDAIMLIDEFEEQVLAGLMEGPSSPDEGPTSRATAPARRAA